MRQDYFSTLVDLGFVLKAQTPSDPGLNANRGNDQLIKSIILGGLWPRVAQVVLPDSAVKFDKVQAGTVRRENEAHEFRLYEIDEKSRLFIHPSSVMFSHTSWKTPFVTYFNRRMTSKMYLMDVTEVGSLYTPLCRGFRNLNSQIPTYSILMFGGPVTVDHIGGGLKVEMPKGQLNLRAWPRIGVHVNQLR